MFTDKTKAMQEAIDCAWSSSEGSVLRSQLFPEGKPSPEEFVQVVSKYIENQLL